LRQWESPLGPPVGTAPSLGCAWLDGPDPPGGRRRKRDETALTQLSMALKHPVLETERERSLTSDLVLGERQTESTSVRSSPPDRHRHWSSVRRIFGCGHIE